MTAISRRNALVLAILALPLLLALSYPWRDATAGVGMVLSAIGWFGFLLDLLVVLALTAIGFASTVRGRRRVRSG